MTAYGRDYELVALAIRYIREHQLQQPLLAEVAAHVGMSEHHFQRLFRRFAGVSPKRFLQFLTLEYARELLERPAPMLDVAYTAGLSGPSRLHDLFVSCGAVTPGQYRLRGEGLEVRYGVHATPFGDCLLAVTPLGICALEFLRDGEWPGDRIDRFRRRWSEAELVEDQSSTGETVRKIFDHAGRRDDLLLHLRGTNFQLQVWEALLRIPEGGLVTYGDVARSVGRPGAVRSVGSAVGKNPVALLIPCHRVIRGTGEFGAYRSGPDRKLALIGLEASTARSRATDACR